MYLKPAQFWVQVDIYYTYACKNCEQETEEANTLKTPKEPVICPGSLASPEANEVTTHHSQEDSKPCLRKLYNCDCDVPSEHWIRSRTNHMIKRLDLEI